MSNLRTQSGSTFFFTHVTKLLTGFRKIGKMKKAYGFIQLSPKEQHEKTSLHCRNDMIDL